MSGTKFYIYASGRWREVDAMSGRISGWGRARFFVSKRGKLTAARSEPVLAALRTLAEGQPSNARDGPPLSFKYPKGKEDPRTFKENGKSCDHWPCCHHNNNNGCSSSKDRHLDNRITVQNRVDAGIQTVTQKSDNVSKIRETSIRKRSSSPEDERKKRKTQSKFEDETQKRNLKDRSDDLRQKSNRGSKFADERQKRNQESLENNSQSESSGDEFQTKVITVATVHRAESNQKKNEIGKRTTLNQSYKKGSSQQNPNKRSSLRSDSETSVIRAQKSPKLKKNYLGKRKRSTSSEKSTDGSEMLGKSKMSQFLRRKSKRLKKESLHRRNISLVASSDSEEPKKSSDSKVKKSPIRVAKNTADTEEPVRKPGPKRIASQNQISSESADETVVKSSRRLAKNRLDTVSKIVPKRIARSKKTGYASSDGNGSPSKQYKELLIEERDVEILRLYIQKHYPDDVLLRFDLDDEFKKLQFHKITPLVHLENCPAIDRMLLRQSQDSQSSQITISDFASKLGLQSVTEISKPKRYKTRKQVNNSDTSEKENGIDINRENDKRIKDNDKRINDNYKKIEDNVRNKKSKDNDKKIKDNDKRIQGNDNEIMELSDSEPEVSQKSQMKKPLKKQPKVVSTKRPALKEYSTLEDHAIVSWVSVGGRASCVNGNKLWISLQEQYSRITGHSRTWHSLRNRYLRYILPRLGALALPPSQQARLRAAAAMGEIKSRKRPSKRNSIFEEPVRGAASRPRQLNPERDEPAPATVHGFPGLTTRSRREPTPPPARRRAPRTPREPSPRYSDLTRKFTAKHLARQHSSDRSSIRSQQKASDSSESARSRPESARNRPESARNRPESARNQHESSWNKARELTRKNARNTDSAESGNISRVSKRKRSESHDESNRYKSRHSVRNTKPNRNESPVTIDRGNSVKSVSTNSKAKRKLTKKTHELHRYKSHESKRNKSESNSDSSFQVEKHKNQLVLNGRSRSKIIFSSESKSSTDESTVKSRKPERQSLRHKKPTSETRRVSLRRKMSPESDRNKSAASDRNKSAESDGKSVESDGKSVESEGKSVESDGNC